MTFLGLGRFEINLKDTVGQTVNYPTFNPPMKFVFEKVDVVDCVLNDIPLPYQHGDASFQFSYEKKLFPDDVTNIFLVSCLVLIDISYKITYMSTHSVTKVTTHSDYLLFLLLKFSF